jgi:hypothetical protein
MTKRLTIVLFSFLLVLAFSTGTAFSATVGLRPVDSSLLNQQDQIEVPVSTVFQFDLFFTGFLQDFTNTSASNGLTDFTINILWDPLIELRSVTPASNFTGGFFTVTPTPNETLPTIPSSVFLGGGIGSTAFNTDEFVLATLEVHCAGFGFTELLTEQWFSGSFNWALQNGETLDETSLNYAGIGINQVPIPSTILLLGGGLAALMGLRRRKSS